jgi:spoIIIJ-associated protein
MSKSIIAEGKTTTEAISNGLKMLNTSKENVNIKILEEHEKRSFFSILAPRVVKVEMSLKENVEEAPKHIEKEIKIDENEIKKSKEKIDQFLDEFIKNFEDLRYETNIDLEKGFLNVNMEGNDSKTLIGYRGEVLNSLQVILNSVSNRGSKEKVRIILNISNYKEKREKSLEELADKISKTVIKTGKAVTLEPMMAYERKIIHNRLQSSNKVKTYSIGEEPYRKVVIAKK